jgi:hypothetical protein
MRLTGTCVLVLSVFAFAGSAYAGNGNGNGNGGGKPDSSAAAPGNSANAPGQEKKDAPPAADQTTTTATTTAGPSEGVKPSNETAHETHAAASSNKTKQYGNDQTAGAIAIKHGAAASTVLHGPGNSQPHKASPCSGGHEVDVHALKGRRVGSCGGSTPQSHPTPSPTPPSDLGKPASDPKPAEQPKPSSNPAPGKAAEGAGADAPASSSSRAATHGALGAAQSAELPFTGAPLWAAVLAGFVLLAAGLALRQIRTVEAAVESGHDHTNRARRPAGSSRPPVGGRSGR